MTNVHIQYECCCADVTERRWEQLMKGHKPCSYKRLVSLIQRDCPSMYNTLQLYLGNPYSGQCCKTRTHYVLVHSAIEYFFSITD